MQWVWEQCEMADRLIKIAEFDNGFEAELARVTLENEGIRATVMGDSLSAIQPYSFPNAVELHVLESDAQRAIAILNECNPLPEEGQQ
jgi:hypothetical protein